jgi:hypothetical protein
LRTQLHGFSSHRAYAVSAHASSMGTASHAVPPVCRAEPSPRPARARLKLIRRAKRPYWPSNAPLALEGQQQSRHADLPPRAVVNPAAGVGQADPRPGRGAQRADHNWATGHTRERQVGGWLAPVDRWQGLDPAPQAPHDVALCLSGGSVGQAACRCDGHYARGGRL